MNKINVLIAITCLTSSISNASDSITMSYGIANDTSAYGFKINHDFTDYLSLTGGITSYSKFKDEELDYKYDYPSVGIRAKYNDFLLDNLSVNAGMNIGALFENKSDDFSSNNDFSINVSPSVGLSYRVSKYIDIDANYSYMVDSKFDLNVIGMGVNIYWDRKEPMISIVNDTMLNDSLKTLRDQGIQQNQKINQAIENYGLTQKKQ